MLFKLDRSASRIRRMSGSGTRDVVLYDRTWYSYPPLLLLEGGLCIGYVSGAAGLSCTRSVQGWDAILHQTKSDSVLESLQLWKATARCGMGPYPFSARDLQAGLRM